MNDYDCIARVIRFLDEHHLQKPTLAELASETGLSPHHFHRLFVRRAGITPKDFLQCLTLEHARAAVRAERAGYGARCRPFGTGAAARSLRESGSGDPW